MLQCEEISNSLGTGITRLSLVRNQLASIEEKKKKKNVPALIKLTPSTEESKTSGGTANILKLERDQSKLNVNELIDFINGGKDLTKRRKFLESMVDKDPELVNRIYNFDRHEHLAHGVKDFIRIHKPYKNYKPTRWDICVMADISIGYGSLNNSHGIFAGTIAGQAQKSSSGIGCLKY